VERRTRFFFFYGMLIGKELCLSRPAKDSNRSTNGDETVTKRVFLRHLYIKMIILPRQARDKHSRENSKKDAFLQNFGETDHHQRVDIVVFSSAGTLPFWIFFHNPQLRTQMRIVPRQA
jgi:hypothetical protein